MQKVVWLHKTRLNLELQLQGAIETFQNVGGAKSVVADIEVNYIDFLKLQGASANLVPSSPP